MKAPQKKKKNNNEHLDWDFGFLLYCVVRSLKKEAFLRGFPCIRNTTKRCHVTYTQREGTPKRQTHRLEANYPSQHRLQKPSKNHSIEIEPSHQHTHSWGPVRLHQRPQHSNNSQHNGWRNQLLRPREPTRNPDRYWLYQGLRHDK